MGNLSQGADGPETVSGKVALLGDKKRSQFCAKSIGVLTEKGLQVQANILLTGEPERFWIGFGDMSQVFQASEIF